MLEETDKRLFSYFLQLPEKEATAKQVAAALKYHSVGAVNLHVVRIAKLIAKIFSYEPRIKSNGQKEWWPCLFYGRNESSGFVWTLKPEICVWYENLFEQDYFFERVHGSIIDSEARRKRLSVTQTKPKINIVQITSFERNPDVVAEVLERASGICECCKKNAPFFKKSDGTPYLEVHHKIPLALGGEDSVENAEALCPNCHRKTHYG